MTGSITTYMDKIGARPLRVSMTDRAVLAIRDGELYTFSSLAVQIIESEERGGLLAAAADRPGPVGERMARLVLGTKSSYPEDVQLDACKWAVNVGDLQRVQMMLDQMMDRVANPFPVLSSEMLRYTFGQNRAVARELIHWTTPEQVVAASSGLLCGTTYAHNLPVLTGPLQEGLQPGDQATPLLRPLLITCDKQRVAHLLRDSLRVQPRNYETMNVCLRAQAQATAEVLLERGMRLDGYLTWTTEQDVLLGTQTQEIPDCLAKQQVQVNSVSEQSGSVLGGMNL